MLSKILLKVLSHVFQLTNLAIMEGFSVMVERGEKRWADSMCTVILVVATFWPQTMRKSLILIRSMC